VKRMPIMISATERARWLAELAAAMDEAQVLLWRIGVAEGDNADARDLYGRLEAARAEIECLRGVREVARARFDPNWTKLSAGVEGPTVARLRRLQERLPRRRTAPETDQGAAASIPRCLRTHD